MTAGEHAQYEEALKRLDCEAAGRLVNSAFIREDPQFARARMKPDCGRHDDECTTWDLYASITFVELGACSIFDLNSLLRGETNF